jgi:hypothetical protein
MQVVSITDKNKEKKKADLLEILDHLRSEIESGKVVEFVAASVDTEGDVQIHAASADFLGAVGLFEIGKQILISQSA